MATTVTIKTTDAEDAAILALTTNTITGQVNESVTDFLTRQARAVIDGAVASAARTSQAVTLAALAQVTPDEQATIDGILAKYETVKASPPGQAPAPVQAGQTQAAAGVSLKVV